MNDVYGRKEQQGDLFRHIAYRATHLGDITVFQIKYMHIQSQHQQVSSVTWAPLTFCVNSDSVTRGLLKGKVWYFSTWTLFPHNFGSNLLMRRTFFFICSVLSENSVKELVFCHLQAKVEEMFDNIMERIVQRNTNFFFAFRSVCYYV